MARINIVIADSDELYLNHLTNYLIDHMSIFDVCSFTAKDSLHRFVGDKTNKVDIIAFTEDFTDEAVNLSHIPVKILLTDGTYTDLEQYESVNKYQKAEKFVNDILMIYAEKTGRIGAVPMGDRKTRVIGFFSPVGGCGKTTMAVATAYALAQKGKKVFYLNSEKINSTSYVLNHGSNGSLSDLYLTVKTKGANIGLHIESNKYTDVNTNISYINPAESSLELNELTAEEFGKMISAFIQLAEFDVVVVDFDGGLNKQKITMLTAMDIIFTPFTSDQMSLAKISLYLQEQGMYDELKEVAAKTNWVLNKSSQQSVETLQKSGLLSKLEVKANISITPIFADLNNVLHSGNGIVPMMTPVTEIVLGGESL